ncbi:MAG TPA: hypothetical protein VGG39_19540 [Polyangiaceae bacterium]|jgi:hypothetical protein
MGYLVVRNLRGTAGGVCRHGSWLDHWYAFTGSNRILCSMLGCGEVVDVGGHVLAVNRADWQHWIAPMCHAHNRSPHDWPIKSDVRLISANTQLMGCYRQYAA